MSWWSPTRGVEIAQTVFSGLFSPYQFNPFNLNPLLDILKSEIDFEALKTPAAVRLLISATRVSDGSLRIFRNADLSADAVMASACLPELFHAVHIDGESYWDGGYVANPALEPLINETDANDLLLVQLNPPRRARVNGFDLAFLEAGDGAPLVFVHGALCDARYWTPQLHHFGKTRRAIALSSAVALPFIAGPRGALR